jgi:hypothetical protein
MLLVVVNINNSLNLGSNDSNVRSMLRLMIELSMTVMVALLTIKMKVAQRLMNTKIAQKPIDANVRFRILAA